MAVAVLCSAVPAVGTGIAGRSTLCFGLGIVGAISGSSSLRCGSRLIGTLTLPELYACFGDRRFFIIKAV